MGNGFLLDSINIIYQDSQRFFKFVYNLLGTRLLVALGVLILMLLSFVIFNFYRKKKQEKYKRVNKKRKKFLKIFFKYLIPKKPKKHLKKKLEEKGPKRELYLFDKKIRYFFQRYLKSETNMDYSKLSAGLIKKNKIKWAEFCQKMNYSLFSGVEITEEDIKKLKKEYYGLLKQKT